MGILWNLAAFIIVLGILITVHEFGHFWVARRCGIYVERFSIGFGKAIWRKTDKHGTEFVIAWIPLGGYVKMLDERVAEVAPERRHLAFNNKTVGQRAAVVAAGPIANFLLAIVAYWIVFMIGVPALKPIIADIRPNSIAEQAKLTPGMELKSVAGIETPDQNAVRLALVSKIGAKEVSFVVLDPNSLSESENILNLQQWGFDPEKQDPILSLGIMPVGARLDSKIIEVTEGSAAEKAGLQAGDRIVKVDGQPIDTWHPFTYFVRQSPNKALELLVERNGSSLILNVTPTAVALKDGTEVGQVGAQLQILPPDEQYLIMQQYNPFSALYEASDKTWQLMGLTVKMIGKLVVGDVKLTNLSGPVSIAKGAGMSADSGFIYYLMFMALISVNLGIINLFPLPVLDGGHLLFLVIEKIKGGPVSERVQDFCYRIGIMALMLLMGLALFNDFSRL
ncbi:sigma E protease regulator RseP [Proteus cibarius]|uniref:Zinc metalloprotease n=1 Tax=Proteus terrae subsp. cibarius TaxID=626774 RepID=A0A8I0WR42_9GAMM|nr:MULTISPECIES: sigma E protease regulator RseP [Proteus]QHP77602.1 sigma E protease regulator RseP [Proteus vulgaris]MBG2914384.1 sigma E protease regulator RseP [Proteus terrae subsp. cibarius]MBG6038370.1 sigma E protease regulator RseP [Proteus terrae subsp. cibarius]MCM2367900.1 sigma E protease regulator RseP [Proteus sp. FZP2095]MCO4181384.1 sigma E protease regulator RseP [Proteus terrae]